MSLRCTVTAAWLLAVCAALAACTSDLDLGVDRAGGCTSDCPQSCSEAAIDACDGGTLNSNCECIEAGPVVDAGEEATSSGDAGEASTDETDETDETDDSTAAEDAPDAEDTQDEATDG